jgi:sec-independent protein translocase protein TatC
MRRARAISHEDRLSLVEHLDELRTRVVVSLAAFGVALGLCFWQSPLLLELANAPLPSAHDKLLTIGVTEPFTTTMTVAAYGAFVLSLPVILYELYAYLLPAFGRQERRTILPLLLLIPVLFVAGLAFGYFVVLPAAAKFLLDFNDSQFNVQVQARDYYSFFGTTLLACGLTFQVPVGILAVVAALPGVDPVSMLLETAPLIALYEVSILLARAMGEPSAGLDSVQPGNPLRS